MTGSTGQHFREDLAPGGEYHGVSTLWDNYVNACIAVGDGECETGVALADATLNAAHVGVDLLIEGDAGFYSVVAELGDALELTAIPEPHDKAMATFIVALHEARADLKLERTAAGGEQ